LWRWGTTLEWLYRLEKFHERQMGDAKTFDAVRSTHPDGESEGGIIYARGFLGHGLASLAELVSFPWPLVTVPLNRGGSRIFGPKVVNEYRWKQFAELPPPGLTEAHGRDRMYERRVQGQPILPPLVAAKGFLEGLP
jgi:hypothetical protein